jgi:hypothetical protein
MQPANNNITDMIALINKVVIRELRKEYGALVDEGMGHLRMTIET